MSQYRTRNRQVAAKIQASVGTEETPAADTDAIRVRVATQFDPQFDNLETDYLQGALDQSGPITGGGMIRRQMPCYLKGSGTPATPPDMGKLLRAAGYEQVITATDVVGQAQGGTTSSITLAVGASATNDAYKGMPITHEGSSGLVQKRVVTAYNGSTKVATVYPDFDTAPVSGDDYTIPAGVLYRPRSSGLEAITLVEWGHSSVAGNNSRRRRLADGAATFNLSVSPRALAQIDFTVTGRLPAAPDDVAKPAAPVYQSSEPAPVLDAIAFLGGEIIRFNELTFDVGNDVQLADDPTEEFGYGPAEIVNRNGQGRLVVPQRLLDAGGNVFDRWLAGTPDTLWTYWGPAAGRLVSLLLPAIRYTGAAPGDTRGYASETCPYRANVADGSSYIWVG
ncbi:MAG: hypothetical protein AB7P02_13270 [Alphaproteobacteria bacterium]